MAAILATFALSSALGVALSVRATTRSRNQASVVEVAARQRTLAERYVNEVLLARQGVRVDPSYTAAVMAASAHALLDGGTAPAVNGDDDEARVTAAREPIVRAELRQEERLVADLTAAGSALLARRSGAGAPTTAHEDIRAMDSLQRLRVLAALTSNVSLNAARDFARIADASVGHLMVLQVLLWLGALLVSLLLAWALIAATRRQTAHFRSLVTSSTDFVVVLGAGGCRYVSQSLASEVGRTETDLLGAGLERFIHPDDHPAIHAVQGSGDFREVRFRLKNRFGEWRHLEARVTDLRADRHIRGVMLNARDVSERVRLEEELMRQAFHDSLTGLANRALFRDRLDQALARSERSNELLAVLLVDLDGFKQVNDTLGHDAGDHLLGRVAQRFAEVTRASDTVARLGGDEFGLLLEGANEATATAAASRLLAAVSDPVGVEGRELRLGASIGIVVHPGGAGSGDELLRHADVAMYAAKEAGRNRYELFQYEMAREVGELLGLEHEIRLGLSRGEFSVHYQPEVELLTGMVVGVEALLRWTSPTRGSVPPMRFIPVAEATGSIAALGEFVLREACRQTAEWRRAGVLAESFVTWINVSGKQLMAGGLRALVQTVLDSEGLPAASLGLEVTETAIVSEGPPGARARAELQALHGLGVKIAIDDFGTGFSSLNHLRRMPVDVLKVDRSFIQGVEHDAKDAAITANLASLAHALGLVAVAEGIESDAQRISAHELGCDLAQGYLFARAAPPEQISGLLGAQIGPVAVPAAV